MQAEPSWQPQQEMRTGSKTEYNKKSCTFVQLFCYAMFMLC